MKINYFLRIENLGKVTKREGTIDFLLYEAEPRVEIYNGISITRYLSNGTIIYVKPELGVELTSKSSSKNHHSIKIKTGGMIIKLETENAK